jgi:hypothetical protein
MTGGFKLTAAIHIRFLNGNLKYKAVIDLVNKLSNHILITNNNATSLKVYKKLVLMNFFFQQEKETTSRIYTSTCSIDFVKLLYCR